MLYIEHGHNTTVNRAHSNPSPYGTGVTTTLRSEQQLEVFAENQAAGLQVVSVRANKGDVVIFHGRLMHRTGPTPRHEDDANEASSKVTTSSTRHVLANHYIPQSFQFWPPLWLTRAYPDLKSRAADGKNEVEGVMLARTHRMAHGP